VYRRIPGDGQGVNPRNFGLKLHRHNDERKKKTGNGNVKSYMKNKPQRTQSAQSNVKKSKEKDRAAKKKADLWALP